jgi:hypothetical protein
MTYPEDGFTMMETLVTISITLVLGGLLAVLFILGTRGTSHAMNTARTAVEIEKTDRTIREWADDIHVPYWAKPDVYAESLTQSIMRSKIGAIVTSITPVYDNKRRIRGLTVSYRVNNKEYQTRAIFPGTPLLDR